MLSILLLGQKIIVGNSWVVQIGMLSTMGKLGYMNYGLSRRRLRHLMGRQMINNSDIQQVFKTHETNYQRRAVEKDWKWTCVCGQDKILESREACDSRIL